MPPQTPYTADLGDADPIVAYRETPDRIAAVTAGWSAERFERSYASGKWSARQILTHLAQTELGLGARARMALSTSNYVAQPFDQDAWMAREKPLSGPDAVAAFRAIARMNHAFFASLSASDRAVRFSHPEYGTLNVDWIVH